jgi:hypothetical protein
MTTHWRSVKHSCSHAALVNPSWVETMQRGPLRSYRSEVALLERMARAAPSLASRFEAISEIMLVCCQYAYSYAY